MQWKGRRVRLTCIGLNDIWLVTDKDKKGWCLIEPRNSVAEDLSKLSPDGKLWVRTRELTQITNQQEELPWTSPTPSP